MNDKRDWEKQLKANGYRVTASRRLIMNSLLQREDEFISAAALHQQLQPQYPQIIFSTVFRNLESLSALGLLCRIDRDNTGLFEYRVNDTPEHHHHHVICRYCGKVEPLHYCPLEQQSPQTFNGYSELECRFEVYGRCRDCRHPES